MKTSAQIILTVLTATLTTATSGYTSPLEIVRTIGGDEGEVFLHNPAWLNWAPDGTLYLLNEGDCQVMHLDEDWELLNAFGQCGGGPGEFENPTGLALHEGRVWVFEMARITIFEMDGTYVRTLVPGSQYAAAVSIGGRLLSRLGAGDRAVGYLDAEGVVSESFGPECPEDFFEAFKQCRNVQILPHDGGRCLLLNLVDGQATLVGEDGWPAWKREMVKKEDDSTMTRERDGDGETVTMSLSLGLGMGMRDSRGRYWINKLPQEEDDPMVLAVMSPDLKTTLAEFELPDGIHAWQLSETPSGRILLVSSGESTIYECELDETRLGS